MAILAISRQLGAGGREIAKAVAEDMGYALVGRAQLFDDMRRSGKEWEQHAERFDERTPTVWERGKWSFRGFIALNQKYIYEHACKDNVVIIGRGVGFLLKGIPYALPVLVTAPIDRRIKRVMRYKEMNRKTAEMLVNKVDREMKGAVYLIYGRNWDDQAEYDMHFDTSSIPIPDIVDQIKTELMKRDSLKTEQAEKILALKALAANIKAEIATDRTFHVSTLRVEPKEEHLVEYGLAVSGVTYVRSDIARIRKTVRTMAPHVPIDYNLEYRMAGRFGEWQFK